MLLQEIEHRLSLVWIDGDEYVAAIDRIAKAGIVGGAVYDGLIATCALKARAEVLYTWNVNHFKMLGEEVARIVRSP